MTRPHEKWTSLDIAEDVRRREALEQDFDRGMLARLAETYDRMDREPPRSLPYWPIGVAVFLGALAMAFAMADPVYPEPPTGPGFETCKTGGC